jgi:hypothetical protein
MLERLDLKLLNVCVASSEQKDWRAEAKEYGALARQHGAHYAWATTFDPPYVVGKDYADRVIAGLQKDFAAGAVACKLWKNIGMEIRKPSGEYLLIDDPLFEPIYAYLEKAAKPALMHIGEPIACWQPLQLGDLHYAYYSAHPEWHMYGKPGVPSHQALMDARDRVLARHPRLRVIGAHLGSLEHDVRQVADRLRRYPNFAVDSSARTRNLMAQDTNAVRDLFLAYPDRILFGTDVVERTPQATLSQEQRQEQLRSLEQRYQSEFAYFESEGEVTHRGMSARGLGLPEALLQRFYFENASAWYPGL